MTSPSWHGYLYVTFYVHEWEVMVEPPQTGLFGAEWYTKSSKEPDNPTQGNRQDCVINSMVVNILLLYYL